MTRQQRRLDWLEWQQMRRDAAKLGAELGLSADEYLDRLRRFVALSEPEQLSLMAEFYAELTPKERTECEAYRGRVARILRMHPN